MRHVGVRRLATLLGVAFLLWAGVFAWLAGDESPARPDPTPVSPPLGTDLFERRCAACHGLAEMRSAAGSAGDAARRAELERFLEGHSDATSEENRQLLDYLTAPPDPPSGSF